MTKPRSVLIVGAGLAGSRCAETLRAEGFDGSVVLLGEEEVPPYERPALSKEFLAGKRRAGELFLRPASFWDERGIELQLGKRVELIDPVRHTATTGDGCVYGWDSLVIATGATPRLLPFAVPRGVHVLRTLADARALRSELVRSGRLVIVGGGFVGTEVASTARDLGVEVTMLEAGEAPFERVLGRDLGELLSSRYRRHGVIVRTRAAAVGFGLDASDHVKSVRLSEGDEVACDAVLVAVGVEPAVELARQRTPSVYLCGDVQGGPGHWTSAAASAVDVARTLMDLEPLPQQPPFFWSNQFGLRIQLVGDPCGAETIDVSGGDNDFVVRYYGREGRLVGALAANRPDTVPAFRRELALAV